MYYDDEILLESVNLKGHFVHLSDFAYDDIICKRDASLSKVSMQ